MNLNLILSAFFMKTIAIGVVFASKNATNRLFPENFLFGVSSAAYQIEGAWNADGKGPSIWDEFLHSNPKNVDDLQNGDIAANSYEYYQDDIDAAKNLKVNFYRFSISWSRVLPTGDITNINEKGIDYYNRVINKLIENNIIPMVTMYHFDLPQKLQLLGGLTSANFVGHFEEYANLLFLRFGDRVKFWLTFNEPAEFCVKGYGNGAHAPGVNAHGIGEYLCGHNTLKAHATAYHLYKNQYYDRFKGKVGLGCDSLFYYSVDNDERAADRAMQFSLGWFAHPIFSSTGNYPSVMISQIANNSLQEGRLRSRLPTFSPEWIEKIRGTADFLGLNYYTSRLIEVPSEPEGPNPSIERDKMYKRVLKPEWTKSASDWLYSVPEGLGDILRWIKKQYNNPEVMIIENGWSDKGELNDDGRIKYLHDHLQQILDVVLNDECNLKGYSVWSIIDNFEWIRGYTEYFGLYSVNMSSPRRERTPKKSVNFLSTVFSTHGIPNI